MPSDSIKDINPEQLKLITTQREFLELIEEIRNQFLNISNDVKNKLPFEDVKKNAISDKDKYMTFEEQLRNLKKELSPDIENNKENKDIKSTYNLLIEKIKEFGDDLDEEELKKMLETVKTLGKETTAEKSSRIQRSVREGISSIAVFSTLAQISKDDEEFRKEVKETLSKQDIPHYMEDVNRAYPTTTEEEIEFYYTKFDKKIKNIIKIIKLPEVTRAQCIEAFEDIMEYTYQS